MVLCAMFAFLFAGCAMVPRRLVVGNYQPGNIYRSSEVLPPQIRRVAILPLTISSSTSLLESGTEILSPVLQSEIVKAKRFEVVIISLEQLHQWTGQSSWKSDEPLPPDFFEHLRQMVGCDAVLFCQLTSYQPYPPLAIGWKFNLVTKMEADKKGEAVPDTHPKETVQILWSADEVFNAGMAEVANGAEAYSALHLHNDAPLAESASILSSPLRFGQYSLSTLFETLPSR